MTRADEIKTMETLLRVQENGQDHHIIRIAPLMSKHPKSAVIVYLERLQKEYTHRLRRLIKVNPGSTKLDQLLVVVFRLSMAISFIRRCNTKASTT